jgi:hypothetical protein
MPPSSGRSGQGDEEIIDRSGLRNAHVLSADGPIRTLPDDFDGPKQPRAMLTTNGGEESHQ